MKKNVYLAIIGFSLVSLFTVGASAQSLNIDVNVGELKEIDDSNYKVQAYSVLRNSDGELISVVKTVATRYFDEPITSQFLDMLPVLKKGSMGDKNVEMLQSIVNSNYEKCYPESYTVLGYEQQCLSHHRATATSLSITDNQGENYEIFRGLNHSYVIKPDDVVSTYWTIIRSD
tara:strand:+ start:981 stop:1502 length:522 start_codon:yes stop_codon:yes gene_type:complete